jgi:hypothetical protein
MDYGGWGWGWGEGCAVQSDVLVGHHPKDEFGAPIRALIDPGAPKGHPEAHSRKTDGSLLAEPVVAEPVVAEPVVAESV